MIVAFITFLFFNFLALMIGGLFTAKGVPSAWYAELNKAPWTPPNWMFGVAWTTIMLCFSLYLMYVWSKTTTRKKLITLFTIQWLLNVAWNPIFFSMQQVQLGALIITLLTLLVGYILVTYYRHIRYQSLLLLPYLLWLLVALSLNLYVAINN
ncbi:MAG: TspO/MBR family protein [Bacteroidota bacterium]